MKNRLIVFLFSLVTAVFFISGGYGFWQEQLVINTTLLVKPPAALEEKTDESETAETETETEAEAETKVELEAGTDTETETETDSSMDPVENVQEGNPIQEISDVTESTITTEEVDSTNSIIED